MQESRQELPEDVLRHMKSRLQIAFGARLRGVILYGSEARHEASKDSDVDLLVLLTGPVNQSADSWACIRALYSLVLELERPIHAKPTDVLTYDAQEMPLYQNVRQEGILM